MLLMTFQNCLKFHSPNAAREITYNNFETSLLVLMPNITTNHAITYTNYMEMTKSEIRDKHICLVSIIFEVANSRDQL